MRPAGMGSWQTLRRRVRASHRLGGVSAAMPRGAALIAWLAVPLPAVAQDNVLATATLPRDLSPWGMYLNADPVVKAVLIGLAFASIVTWTVWLAKTIEIVLSSGVCGRHRTNSPAYAPRSRTSSSLPKFRARSPNS